MKDGFLQPKPLGGLNSKLSLLDENKIKNIENRLMGPNNEGKAPSECQPLKESELENIKTNILLNGSLAPKEIKENINIINENNKNKNNLTIKTNSGIKKNGNNEQKGDEKYLQKKRNYGEKSHKNSIIEEPYLNDDFHAFDKNNSNKSNLSAKSYKSENNNNSGSEQSPKNINNGNNTTSNKYNKTIKDYYRTDFISRSNNNSNHIKNNNTIITTHKKNSIDKHNSNLLDINDNNNNEYNDHNNNITVEQLMKKISEQNLLIEAKEKELSKLKLTQKENEEIINDLQQYKKNSDIEIKRCRLDISNMAKEIAELKREKKNKWINEQEYSLGKFGIQRFSHGQVIDYWEDGTKMIEIKKALENIKNQKEEIDKQRRKISSNKSRKSQNEDNNNNYDQDESKELLNFKMSQLQKEESELKDKKNRLEIEKSILIHEINLYNQESRCTFSQKKEGWPLLGGRYQIVGLLGKGGYSEVYKAYDLENHIYVACKLHQLNQNWKEEVKDNYIKHTIRENQIHKEINHSKIVKHFDTIEIDNNSFCTVLEYCSGPDLATYLQRNRFIQEKEARIIITQILEGLEYLNKLPNKIIHYDLKPENIIFNNMEVKISDFGLAKIVESNTDRVQLTSQGVGTYWYLPPECFEEKKKCKYKF